MKKNLFGVLLLTLLMLVTGCEGQPQKKEESKVTTQKLEMPEIPVMIQSPEERVAYITKHYWDKFDFADTTLTNNEQYTEQAFADFIGILPQTTLEVAGKAISVMLEQAINANQQMFDYFVELYDKYLYNPNSPLRNEDYYIEVLKAIIDNPKVEEIYKARPRYQLETALKNRIGDIAANFDYVTPNGQKGQLYDVTSEYTILFFNDPDCHDCARVTEILKGLDKPKVKVVAIYTDKEIELWKKKQYPELWINGQSSTVSDQKLYDLRAIPTLYLLDKQKQVVLKDAPVEMIMDWINGSI